MIYQSCNLKVAALVGDCALGLSPFDITMRNCFHCITAHSCSVCKTQIALYHAGRLTITRNVGGIDYETLALEHGLNPVFVVVLWLNCRILKLHQTDIGGDGVPLCNLTHSVMPQDCVKISFPTG